jgi:hypothetical protein
MTLFLSDSIHQGTKIFSVHSRGKQTTCFYELSALLTTHNKPLIEWSNTTLSIDIIPHAKAMSYSVPFLDVYSFKTNAD